MPCFACRQVRRILFTFVLLPIPVDHWLQHNQSAAWLVHSDSRDQTDFFQNLRAVRKLLPLVVYGTILFFCWYFMRNC